MDNMKDILPIQDCPKLLDELQSTFTWTWDGRFNAALVEISTDKKDTVERILEKHLGMAWDSTTIKTAPQSVKDIIAPLGGLMKGQFIFAGALGLDGILFCAWWPWGNGQTISIRIGTTHDDSSLLASLVPLAAR